MPHPSLVKSKSMFSFAAPKIWNSLPLPLREISSVSLFKMHLKSYFLILLLRMLPVLNNCAMFYCSSVLPMLNNCAKFLVVVLFIYLSLML